MAATAPEPDPRSRTSRLLEPLKRLFGPQMSSAARERRDVLVLLFAVTFVVVPHFEHLPWWATALLLLMLFWRGFLTATQHPLPGRMLMVPLLLGAGLGVYLQHGTLVGQQAGVTFLLLLMALKLLEMRARRDIFVVIFLSFFILLTQFLLGIVVNLFVDVPDTHPGAGVANYVVGAWRSIGWVLAREWPVLALHVIVGLGLVAGSLTFLIRGLLARNWGALLLWNAIGAAGAAFAALNGTYFVIHPKVDSASLFMAVGFAVAIVTASGSTTPGSLVPPESIWPEPSFRRPRSVIT